MTSCFTLSLLVSICSAGINFSKLCFLVMHLSIFSYLLLILYISVLFFVIFWSDPRLWLALPFGFSVSVCRTKIKLPLLFSSSAGTLFSIHNHFVGWISQNISASFSWFLNYLFCFSSLFLVFQCIFPCLMYVKISVFAIAFFIVTWNPS